MILMRLPGHRADRGDDRGASQGGNGLQGQGDAILPSAEPQPRQDQEPLLVQVLGLEVDQPALISQEGVEFRVVPCAAPAPPERRRHRRPDPIRAGRRLSGYIRFRLFAALCHGERPCRFTTAASSLGLIGQFTNKRVRRRNAETSEGPLWVRER